MQIDVTPMFPLGMVVFPHQVVGLCVFEPRYQQLLHDIHERGEFATCLIARGSEVGGGDERTDVATLVDVRMVQPLADGKYLVMVEGRSRHPVLTWLEDEPYPRARLGKSDPESAVDADVLKLAESSVRALRALQSEVRPDEVLAARCEMAEDPIVRSWQLCSMTPMGVLDQFRVLEVNDATERLRLLVEICCDRYGDYQRMLAMDADAPRFE